VLKGASALRAVLALCLLLPLAAACAPAQSPAAPTGAPAATTAPVPTSGPLPAPPAAATAAPKPTQAPSAAVPKAGGSMVSAAAADAVSFHPYTTTDSGSRGYAGLVYDGSLWTYDPHSLEPRPEAATGWTTSDDRLTYTFTLRDDLRWSDGTPLTSADYKWTFDQAANPANKYPYISNLELIAAYEAPDPRTIVVTMKEPIVVGLEAVDAVTPLPRHIWQGLDWGDPSKNPQIMAPTVSSGPYILREWVKDDHATFVANDLYHGGRPLIDTVTVRIVPSQEIAFQMLKSGEVDYAGFTPDNYPEAKSLPNVTVYEWWPAAASWSYLGFNLRRPWLQDVTVRHALAHAIDRDAIAEYVLNGLARPTYSIFPPSSWVYNPNVPKYEYNPTVAGELLDKAGWARGPGGIRQKDGQQLRLRLLFGPNTSKVRERIATIAQQAWQDLGVAVDVQGLEWGTYLSTLKSEPFDWDVSVLGWNSTLEPHWMNQIWREDAIPELNAVAYVNKRVEQLFDQGVREFDREKRKQIYQEIQQIISTDAPYVFLTTDLSYVGINNRVGGIEPTPLGIGHNRERWFIK
jgi:peptide/nickel transport system substrate-binding protein